MKPLLRTLLLLILPASTYAQLKPAQPQILWPPVTEIKVVAINPDGGLIYLKLGPDIVYNKATSTLDAKQYYIVFSMERLTPPTPPELNWTLPKGCIPTALYVSGKLQYPFAYTTDTGTHIDYDYFFTPIPANPDPAARRLVWNIGRDPKSTDTVAIACARNVP